MRDGSRERWLLPAVVDRPTHSSISPMVANGPNRALLVAGLARAVRSLARVSFLALAIASVAMLVVSMAGRAEVVASYQERPERTYALRGDLTAALALDLQAALRAGFRRITVTSRGGEILVARAMADLLNRAGASLVAQGQCHSACTYMWLATKRRELGTDADLALHATFDDHGPNDFGELWLRELGRSDLARWARTGELHHLTPSEVEPERAKP
jgi:hypothetical protein